MTDDGNTGPGAAGASRGPQGGSGFTALSPVYETRQLKIAYGIQFHKDESLDVTPQQYLDKYLVISDDLEKVSDSEYINHLQGVRFTIEETISKSQFFEWLKTPELHVVYMGHARYGRGPCFGAHGLDPANRKHLSKSEDWEEGSDGASGIFRMGYPFIGVEVSEIFDHGYTARPVKESEGKPARADCDPYVRGYLGALKARAPEDVSPGLTSQLRDHNNGDRYWSYESPEGRAIIHHAGWQNTFSIGSELGTLHDPDDPDNSQMLCRVFTHLGCTTYVHNYPVVRKLAKWQRTDNERYAYWTTYLSAPHAVGPWVRALIAYNKWNAFSSWEPSLKWAVDRANRSLRALGAAYQLI
jgi:hypothetical protein